MRCGREVHGEQATRFVVDKVQVHVLVLGLPAELGGGLSGRNRDDGKGVQKTGGRTFYAFASDLLHCPFARLPHGVGCNDGFIAGSGGAVFAAGGQRPQFELR
mgnify:CR=1 FL=1